MKKILLLLALMTPGLQAQSKIGFVDFQYLISQVQTISEIQLELQKLSSEWTLQIEALRDSLAYLEKDLDAMSLTLTRSGKNVLEKNITDLRAYIKKFQEQKFSPASGELYKKQQELLQPILDKVKRAVDNVRLKEKYDVIFDVSTGNPVSIDKKLDLTTLVLDEFESIGLAVVKSATQQQQPTNRDNKLDGQRREPVLKQDPQKKNPTQKKDESENIKD